MEWPLATLVLAVRAARRVRAGSRQPPDRHDLAPQRLHREGACVPGRCPRGRCSRATRSCSTRTARLAPRRTATSIGTYTTSGSNITITPGPSTMAFRGEESLDAIYIHMSAPRPPMRSRTTNDADPRELGRSSSTRHRFPAPAASLAVAESPASAPSGRRAARSRPSTHRGHGEGPGLPGRDPGRPAGELHDHVQPRRQLPGQADCNAASGTYSTADPTAASGDLSIFLGPSTLAMCPEGPFGDLFMIGLERGEL